VSPIDDLDAVKKVDQAIAENERLQTVYLTGYTSEVDGYDAALAQHEQAVADALEAGRVPPTYPPVPPSAQAHADRRSGARRPDFLVRDQAPEAGRRQVEGGRREPGDLLLIIRAKYADLIQEAKRPVGTVTRIGKEIGALADCLHEVTCAGRGQGGSRPPAPGKVDAEAVVAAVQRDVDLLEQEPERRLGMVSNLHEVRQPPPGSEPAPGAKPLRTSADVPPGYSYGR
jgi:hypothetical protein